MKLVVQVVLSQWEGKDQGVAQSLSSSWYSGGTGMFVCLLSRQGLAVFL